MSAAMDSRLDSNPYAVRRTQAMPKHSLFGTALELYSREEKEHIDNIDVNAITLPDVKNSRRKSLPDYIKANIKGRECVATNRHEFEERKKATENARKNLKTLEQDAILMCTGAQNDVRSSRDLSLRIDGPERKDQWLSSKDLEHSREINFGCMPDNSKSYNREKHSRRPPMYGNYTGSNALQLKDEAAIVSTGQGLHQRRRRNCQMDVQELTDDQKSNRSHSCVHLPPNIRHQFGSRTCDSLLSNEQKVSDTLTKLMTLNLPRKKQDVPTSKWTNDASTDYNMISNMTRQNVFPGHSIGNAESTTKLVFNDQVHLRRVAETDEYKYRRDPLSTWSEQHILRVRMDKQWDSYLQSLPRTRVTWDRDARRPAPKNDPVTKPKAKPKPKQTTQTKPQAEPKEPTETEEEFVFKTPPLTPLPEPDLAPMPQTMEQDDEFWKFYDQSA